MFAEGTRSRDGRLGPLKKGAFHLAAQALRAILPVTFSGSRAVLPRQGWVPRPGRIDVQVGEPIATDGVVNAELLEEAAGALRAGYTERHRDDLAAHPSRPGPSPGAEATR